MIVSFYRFGRLGNRLFTFSNLIAFAELHEVSVAMPAFAEYRNSFPYFDRNPACVFRGPKGYLLKIASAFSCRLGAALGSVPTVRFWDGRRVYFDAEDERDPRIQKMIQSPAVVFEGWDFCSRSAILMFRDTILRVFSPNREIQSQAKSQIGFLRNKGDIAVGVHIRWGDYRRTERFFELSEYIERMNQIEAILAPSKVIFLVFSHEVIPQDAFPVNTFICSSSSAVTDMYSLAECDYIVGPPSTFSMWASYYGARPLFIMKAGERFIDQAKATVAIP